MCQHNRHCSVLTSDLSGGVSMVAEAKAAEEAGLNVVVVVRPGNLELSEEERGLYTLITSFSQLQVTGSV